MIPHQFYHWISTGRTRQDSDKWFYACVISLHGKLVIEIAHNYRKKRFLQITSEPGITGKKEKFSPQQIPLRFRCKKPFVAI
jgi:hypothetical protein